MNTEQLILKVRTKVQDLSPNQLWTDEELIFNINEAQRMAALSADLIFDKTSQRVTVLSTVGVSSYDLDPSVYRIKRARLDGRLLSEMDEENAGNIEASGSPGYWYIGEDRKLHLDKKPISDGIIKLEAYCMPADLVNYEDECQIPAHMQDQMLSWAYKLCYEKLDAEVNRPDLAMQFEKEFIKTFGVPRTASQWKKQALSRRSTVRMHRF